MRAASRYRRRRASSNRSSGATHRQNRAYLLRIKLARERRGLHDIAQHRRGRAEPNRSGDALVTAVAVASACLEPHHVAHGSRSSSGPFGCAAVTILGVDAYVALRRGCGLEASEGRKVRESLSVSERSTNRVEGRIAQGSGSVIACFGCAAVSVLGSVVVAIWRGYGLEAGEGEEGTRTLFVSNLQTEWTEESACADAPQICATYTLTSTLKTRKAGVHVPPWITYASKHTHTHPPAHTYTKTYA